MKKEHKLDILNNAMQVLLDRAHRGDYLSICNALRLTLIRRHPLVNSVSWDIETEWVQELLYKHRPIFASLREMLFSMHWWPPTMLSSRLKWLNKRIKEIENEKG